MKTRRQKTPTCGLCSLHKIAWNGAYLCLRCDDRGTNPHSVWLNDWAASITSEEESK